MPESFEVVFDGAGGDVGRAALARTVDGGRFFAHGAASGDFATSATGLELLTARRSVVGTSVLTVQA